MKKFLLCALVCLSASFCSAQGVELMRNAHPYHVEARHWGPSPPKLNALQRFWHKVHPLPRSVQVLNARLEACQLARQHYVATSELPADSLGCGSRFYSYDGENLITSAGQTAISKQMADTAAQPASGNYVALTNTGITPAVADTTLSGEISSNGLSRAQATFADTSAAIGAPPTPSAITQTGSAGATTVDYWVFACTYQGCTAVGTGVQTTASNATLSAANYNTGTFTGKLGAAYYRIIRTHNNTTPSGSLAGGSTISTADGEISTQPYCADLVAGTAPTCTFADVSNTLTAFTVPASDQTFVGKYTLTKTFTCTTAPQAAQAFGIFNASSSGTLFFEGTFASASLQINDTLSFTETVFH